MFNNQCPTFFIQKLNKKLIFITLFNKRKKKNVVKTKSTVVDLRFKTVQ